MELKEGMYVRTDNGIIEKVNKIYDRHATDNIVVWLNGYGDGRSVFIDDFEEVKYQSINARGFIKKEPSFNITDLMEEGDFVKVRIDGIFINCFMVDKFEDENENIELGIGCYEDGLLNTISEYRPLNTLEILEVLTKEQFESMSYKVGE